MKAQKVTVRILIEALSIDCLPGLLTEVIENVRGEKENGELRMQDGDHVAWETERKNVEF